MDVILRDVRECDLPTLYEHQRDPAASDMAAFTPRSEEEFMRHWRRNILADAGVIAKAVVCDGRVVGNILCFARSGRREVGYWIAREHWGRGIATAALAQLLDLVTERPVYAVVAKHNVASLRVLEKCGFSIRDRRAGSPDARSTVVEEIVLELGAAG